VIAFDCYANQFGNCVKARDFLAVILQALTLTGLIGAETTFYLKNIGN